MAVGFVLPPGTRSRANTDQPQAIMQEFLPWGESGNDGSGQFATPGTPAFLDFVERFQGRYGRAKPGQVIPDAPGLHHTDYESALTEIADSKPAWFALRNLGSATGKKDPSLQEIFDAQYALNIHQEVLDEARQLFREDTAQVPDPSFGVIREDIAELNRLVQKDLDDRMAERRWWQDRLAEEIAKVNGNGPGQKRAAKELRALAAERPMATPTQNLELAATSRPDNTLADVRWDIANLTTLVRSALGAGGDEFRAWRNLFAKEVARLEGEHRKKAAEVLLALAAKRPLVP